ncbi:NAD(P)/FAD-dependent oxidoreductase [Sphingomonas bacterium]|uniref:FAD-dependent oxidoreductase n=1 Tax=Sphingomonas bacterium TaxID=1895847 RepID=UPI00261C62BC|nr:NAD(P)/FAD-dependent oxidoreductase [Sphingomonas bacterium]MDB5677798.1 glutamate synthase [Sphingomonas bacterium]
MTRSLDIAIAGCGPCGLAAALLLHRDGHCVTLFERFETPRPIGSGLMIQPTGRAVLRELGLEDALVVRGARIDRLFGMNESGRTVLDVRYAALDAHAFGVGIHRATLFDLLHRAVAEAGIAIEGGRTIVGSERGSLLFADGKRAGPFDLIVDALGSRSALAPSAGRELAFGALWTSLDWVPGFDRHALEQRYHAASRMVGVLPIGGSQAAFFWSLRADRLDAWRAAGLDAWKSEVRTLWPATEPLLDQIFDPDQLTFARYAHRTLRDPREPGLIHLGDAWHSTSPQLGQGVNMALLDAWALAFALRERESLPNALALAVSLRREQVSMYQLMSRLFTPVYQSDSTLLPWLRDVIVAPLAKTWPAPKIMAAMVAGVVGGPMRRLGLA